jgi:EF-P beta-lysylation protein EpmB
MIPASPTVVYIDKPIPWQQELSASQWSADQLAQRLNLPSEQLATIRRAAAAFPIRATESYLQRIEPGNLDDPLLRQILPTAAEGETVEGYHTDPVGDHAAMRPGGVLQKYHGRALLITTAACAIHCRYCFRRHYPYSEHSYQFNQQQTIRQLASDPALQEVILSGGDPLMLSDARLATLLEQLEALPQLTTVRLHSRIPVVLPSRITRALVERLQQSRLQVVVVIHCNHPNELDRSVAGALQQLQRAGVTLLNQSVLLQGVNDQLETLQQLSHKLFRFGVLPYYLHLLDRVSGSHHFDLPEAEARSLYRQLQASVPGYLLPRLVREIEGAASKTPIPL